MIGENCTRPLPIFAEVGRACETKDGYDQSVIKFVVAMVRSAADFTHCFVVSAQIVPRPETRLLKLASSYNLSTVSLNYKHNSFKFSVQRDHG